MFDETTPVKACGDLAYHVGHSGIHFFIHLLFTTFFDVIVLVGSIEGIVASLFHNMKVWLPGNVSKQPEECRDASSQVKRRRMLQFNSQPVTPHSIDERSSAFLKSNVSAD